MYNSSQSSQQKSISDAELFSGTSAEDLPFKFRALEVALEAACTFLDTQATDLSFRLFMQSLLTLLAQQPATSSFSKYCKVFFVAQTAAVLLPWQAFCFVQGMFRSMHRMPLWRVKTNTIFPGKKGRWNWAEYMTDYMMEIAELKSKFLRRHKHLSLLFDKVRFVRSTANPGTWEIAAMKCRTEVTCINHIISNMWSKAWVASRIG